MIRRNDRSCDFCRIVHGEHAGIWLVYEDADTLAFFPDKPAVDGHTLVIPKQHNDDIWEISEPQALSVMKTVLWVAHTVLTALQPDGLNIIHSSGEAAGQSVRHIHFHVVPRRPGDAIGDPWPESPSIPDSAKDATLAAIRSALA